MKITRPIGLRGFVLMMSIWMVGVMTMSAQTKEPGPFEKFFHWVGHGSKEPPPVKTSAHHSAHKRQTGETQAQPSASATAQVTSDGTNRPPNDRNTKSASPASTRKREDIPYGTPVPGKEGLVTSPFSPNSGYIDVRGLAPGTPVRDPYTGKIFLTP